MFVIPLISSPAAQAQVWQFTIIRKVPCRKREWPLEQWVIYHYFQPLGFLSVVMAHCQERWFWNFVEKEETFAALRPISRWAMGGLEEGRRAWTLTEHLLCTSSFGCIISRAALCNKPVRKKKWYLLRAYCGPNPVQSVSQWILTTTHEGQLSAFGGKASRVKYRAQSQRATQRRKQNLKAFNLTSKFALWSSFLSPSLKINLIT